jgi:hypothetical protein
MVKAPELKNARVRKLLQRAQKDFRAKRIDEAFAGLAGALNVLQGELKGAVPFIRLPHSATLTMTRPVEEQVTRLISVVNALRIGVDPLRLEFMRDALPNVLLDADDVAHLMPGEHCELEASEFRPCFEFLLQYAGGESRGVFECVGHWGRMYRAIWELKERNTRP